MMAASHVSAVRALYKHILRLHQRLPLELKAIGDEYVKSEFRRHKSASPEFVPTFMQEWKSYALMMEAQTAQDGSIPTVGGNIADEKLDHFREEQLGQLLELRKETAKPSQFVTDGER